MGDHSTLYLNMEVNPVIKFDLIKCDEFESLISSNHTYDKINK